MFMLRITFCLSCLCATAVSAYGEEKLDPIGAGSWEKLGTKDGVKQARKRIKGNDLFAVRGEAVLEHPLDRVATVINDHTRWNEWAKAVTSSKLLARDQSGDKIVYQAFDMPMLISDRDTVYKFGMKWQGQTLKIVGQSVEHPQAPPTVGIRTKLITGRWSLSPEGPQRTRLVLEVLMDPMGRLPSWLVNIVQRNYPADTITNLRAQLRRPDLEILPLPTRPPTTN